MRTPSWRSSVFTCSSCWPSSSRKNRGAAKRTSGATAAASSGKELAASRAEELVRGGERLVEARRILAARLREVGTAAPAAADERRQLLDDVAGVEASDQILRHRGE